MKLRFLGKCGSTGGNCPTLLSHEHGYVVQAWRTETPGTVELPHKLLGFLEPDTFIGAPMTDTGRGTFRLTGRPISDTETLAQLDLADDETAIEVPKTERTFYGATATRQSVA
ncbi:MULTISPECIES: hypothetical protein [Nocardia]|uniref:hypothetical protein n=1 Tax=Nocardia TaxID=1817 RepID=UPI0007EB5906|nr:MULTISPECIES: hypothetical protein [Nocardia]MBF6278743.1 hypothetical protein [Nocardia nova]OBA50688.1 hypothetical protein A5789_28460 [Nocardia sp. 852002-51101_SCH5132738]OBB34496.1 hypothetical protein A5748_06570 [Nocardia sp. 852002-51244_SCH5132740]OBF62981.1 hypothetical protein A9X06_10460 [Mycobacterium sp. 852002-51759_SCH5129042]